LRRSPPWRPPARGWAPALLCALGLGAACAAPESHPNVLLLVVDTLRADHLGTYGYPLETSPVIDRFAAQHLQFDHAVSTAPWTSPSVASLFTGLYPTAHGVDHRLRRNQLPYDAISEDFTTLAEVFAAAGYRTAGVTANAWVSSERGYSQGFQQWIEVRRVRARRINHLGIEFLESWRGSSEPFFLYLHYMDPHPPLRVPREFRELFDADSYDFLPPSAKLRDEAVLYDAEIRYLDTALGELFAYLEEAGLWEDLVVVLVADHGRQFLEHGEWGHGKELYNEETHVPFLLKADGRRGHVESTVSTIDLYPTLLRVAGLGWPGPVQGVALPEQLELRRERGAFSEVTVRRNHKSFVGPGELKLVLDFEGQSHDIVDESMEKGVVGLFATRDDHLEQHPLDDPEATQRLRAGLYRQYRESVEIRGSVEPGRGALGAETIEELRHLGYLDD
jgi:arylsulfatase A-like enzyme